MAVWKVTPMLGQIDLKVNEIAVLGCALCRHVDIVPGKAGGAENACQ